MGMVLGLWIRLRCLDISLQQQPPDLSVLREGFSFLSLSSVCGLDLPVSELGGRVGCNLEGRTRSSQPWSREALSSGGSPLASVPGGCGSASSN